MAELDAEFGDRLRRSRRAAGITQEGLAERAGVSSRAVSDLERGVIRVPRRDTLVMLADALDLPPEERAEWERIRRRDSTRAPSGRQPAATAQPAAPVGADLPAQLDPLIGREHALTEIGRLLASARLVTLTGPGGIGKTRLGIAAGRAACDRFADGVSFVELALVRDAGLVAAAIGRKLGAPEIGGQSTVSAVQTYLGDKQQLLVLDNFEQVLDAASVVADLLGHAPALAVLVTSRERLGLPGEHEYPVAPLALPDPASPVSLQQIERYPATALFIQRARQVNPGFDLGADSRATVASICRRLGGLPLALELAAARIKIMSPDELLARLDRPLAVLTSGSRHLPDRQQTIRKTLQWSYDLLDVGEQRLLQRLSVFVGGWTLEAVEAVGGGDAVLDRLASLVDKSLVTQVGQRAGQSRFGMLEVVREFAHEHLEARDTADEVRREHAEYFLALADELAPGMRGPSNVAHHTRLSADHENLRAALTYALASDPARALHTAAVLEKYWFARGSFIEWEYWISETLRCSSGVSDSDRARALTQLSFVLLYRDEPERARAPAEEALAIASDRQLIETMGRATGQLGMIAQLKGDLPGALSLARQALDLYRQSGVEIAAATQLGNIALLEQEQGEYERALRTNEESAEILLAHGEMFFGSRALSNVGFTLHALGRLDEAAERFDTAISMARDLGAPETVAGTSINRAHVAIDQGDDRHALQLLAEGLIQGRAVLNVSFTLLGLEGVAIVALARGEARAAARLFSAIDTLRRSMKVTLVSFEQARLARYLAGCRSALEARDWQDAWSAGQALALAQATALAREHIARWQADEW